MLTCAVSAVRCGVAVQNSMLANLNILAESKGYTKQGQPQPRQRIPLLRSMTSAALPRNGAKQNSKGGRADTSPAMLRRESSARRTRAAQARSNGQADGARQAGQGRHGGKGRGAADDRKVAEGAYGRLGDVDEESEDDEVAELHAGPTTPLSAIVVAGQHNSTLSAQPSVVASRSRSEATYDSSMAVFTPAGQPSRRRAFFPATSETSVLVEETMDDGSVRVIVAHDTMAAVQHMQQQAEQQRHTDEAHSSTQAAAAHANTKREADEPLDPISNFAAKLLDFNSHSSHSQHPASSGDDGYSNSRSGSHSRSHSTEHEADDVKGLADATPTQRAKPRSQPRARDKAQPRLGQARTPRAVQPAPRRTSSGAQRTKQQPQSRRSLQAPATRSATPQSGASDSGENSPHSSDEADEEREKEADGEEEEATDEEEEEEEEEKGEDEEMPHKVTSGLPLIASYPTR